MLGTVSIEQIEKAIDAILPGEEQKTRQHLCDILGMNKNTCTIELITQRLDHMGAATLKGKLVQKLTEQA